MGGGDVSASAAPAIEQTAATQEDLWQWEGGKPDSEQPAQVDESKPGDLPPENAAAWAALVDMEGQASAQKARPKNWGERLGSRPAQCAHWSGLDSGGATRPPPRRRVELEADAFAA